MQEFETGGAGLAVNYQHRTDSFVQALGVSIRARRVDLDEYDRTVLIEALDPNLGPALEALRLWAASADPPAKTLHCSHAPMPPDILVLCGMPVEGEGTVMGKIAEWRKSAILVIWIVPPSTTFGANDLGGLSEADRWLMSAVDVTVLVNGLRVPSSLQELDGCWAVARAARGLLHDIIFYGLVCVDLADIRALLTGSNRSPLLHFSICSQSDVPPSDWWPEKYEFGQVAQVVISTIMSDQSGMLQKFDTFVQDALDHLEDSVDYITTLGCKDGGPNFEAEVYVRFSQKADTR